MRLLRDASFKGDAVDIALVKENFGRIEFEAHPLEYGRPVGFAIKRATNYYTGMREDGYQPIFLVSPNTIITCIWPDDIRRYKDIKYGTSSRYGTLAVITPGIAFHLPNGIGLYLCLTSTGEYLENRDNFGI